MEVYTYEQELLAEYLIALGTPLTRGLCIIALLWEEEATMEMLEYIAKTEETDHGKLYSVAQEISKKYENL